MSDSKYWICEEHEIPNIDENLSQVMVPIVRGNWTLCIYTSATDNRSRLYTALEYTNGNHNSEYGVHYSIQILNQVDPSKNTIETHRKGIASNTKWLCEYSLPIEEISNGFLKNGVLKVRVSLHVESIICEGEAAIWNFAYPFFDYVEKKNTLLLEWNRSFLEMLYVHHQAVKLHSKILSDSYSDAKGNISLLVPPDINIDVLHVCLQIMHGVFIEDFLDSSVLETAFDFQMRNVMWIIERQLIEVKKYRKEYENLILSAIMFRMERLLKHLLMDIDTIEEFKEILQKIEIHKMSSESMKAVVARFLAYD